MNARPQSGVTLIEMLIVVMIIALIAGITFPALAAGLASVRLNSASGSAASFLTATMNRVERREMAVAVVIAPQEDEIGGFHGGIGRESGTDAAHAAGDFRSKATSRGAFCCSRAGRFRA